MIFAVTVMWCSLLFIMLSLETTKAWEWNDKITLFPSLPIAAPWSKNEECRNHSRMLLQGLSNFTMWAIQMLDSSAREPGGVLYGNLYQLGNFDECLEVTSPIQSQYCLAKVSVKVLNTTTAIDPFIQKYEPVSSVWDRIKNDANPAKVPRNTVYQALCVPASCSHHDIEKAVSHHLKNLNNSSSIQYTAEVAPNLCHTSKQEPFTLQDYIFMGIMASIVLLVVIGTTLDYCIIDSSIDTLSTDLLLCFSVRQNLIHLNSETPGRLRILNSIKFICICLIILNHRGAYFGASPLWNLEYIEREFQSMRLALMYRGDLIVDTFFIISGLLMAYLLLQELPTKKLNPVYFIMLRFIRLTPGLSLLVFFYATLFYKMGTGPRWDVVVGPERDFCQKNWWTNLLFINNYVNEQHMCLLQSYFLACDMHFFIIAMPLVILIWRQPSLGSIVLAALILASMIIPFLVTYMGHKPAIINFYNDVLVTPRSNEILHSVYIKSHARATPYFTGIALGFLLHKLRDCEHRIGMMSSTVLCLVTVNLLFGVMMSGLMFYDPARPYNPLEAALYAGIHRFVWAIGTSAFIVILIFGTVPLLSTLMSSKVLIVLGNLVYCLFLVHPVFQYWSLGSLRRPEYIQYTNVMIMGIGDIVSSLFAALLLYLSVEEPCRQIIRRLIIKKPIFKQE